MPSIRPIPKIKKKAHVVKPCIKQWEARPFEERWPQILKDMIANPGKQTPYFWKKWRPRIDNIHSYNVFVRQLKKHGMMPGVVKAKTAIKEQVSIAIESFAAVRKEHANVHMTRIHKKLEEIHQVVEQIPVTENNVSTALDLVSKLHKEGRLAYGIDEESVTDKKVTNLAIMIGYEPQPKVKTIEV